MNQTQLLARQLQRLEEQLNSSGGRGVKFHQQAVKQGNMSFTGGNGRIWISPAPGGFDVALSGKSLRVEMESVMNKLCGKICDGHKQTNRKIGKLDAPYWRVADFKLVESAVTHYAKTRP